MYHRLNVTLFFVGGIYDSKKNLRCQLKKNSTIARFDCPTDEEYLLLKEAIGVSA
jgi:hypothetical protein